MGRRAVAWWCTRGDRGEAAAQVWDWGHVRRCLRGVSRPSARSGGWPGAGIVRNWSDTAMNPTPGLRRLARLEHEFGDPFESSNPLGFDRILEADEAEAMFGLGEQALAEFGLNAEFVPSRLG